MKIVIAKLEQTQIPIQLVYVYYNIYLIKAVYFGCGIIQLTPNEEKILKAIYEEPILIKLGYSKKFPRRVLYMRKNVLGIGLLRPKTIMKILALKLYIGYKRVNTIINQLINTIEDIHFVKSSYNEEVLKQHKNQQTNVIT